MSCNFSVITLDIDWAPDFMIDAVADLLLEYELPATWFVTHESPSLDRLRNFPDLFELGIHPNFLEGSTHGHSHKQVLDYCMSIVPEAISFRSHGVYHSGRLIKDIIDHTPLRVESNAFLPEMPHIRPLAHQLPNGLITRVPFFWSDDYELCKLNPNWDLSRLQSIDGMRVYLFHPVHLYLNTNNPERYELYRQHSNQENIDICVNSVGEGALTAFKGLCQSLIAKKEKTVLLKDLKC